MTWWTKIEKPTQTVDDNIPDGEVPKPSRVYPFEELARYEVPRVEIRKLEGAVYGRNTGVLLKTSTRFFHEGQVIACSEALVAIPGMTLAHFKKQLEVPQPLVEEAEDA